MLPNENSEKDSRILVDEDWKQQVEREREELRKQGTQDVDASEPPFPSAPPFDVLVSMLANQALAALGILPNPESGKTEPNRPAARFFIDLLGELEKKTKGNLSGDEAEHLGTALHHLRMVFVSELPPSEKGAAEGKPRPIIELP